MADIAANGLDVKFLKQVFIKRMSAYKAVMLVQSLRLQWVGWHPKMS